MEGATKSGLMAADEVIARADAIGKMRGMAAEQREPVAA